MLPACAATDVRLMMRPHFRARIPGSTACVIRNTDERLTWMISFQLASVIWSMLANVARPGVVEKVVHRAEAGFDGFDQCIDVGALRHISSRHERAAACARDLLRGGTCIGLAADVIHGDVAASCSQCLRDRLADPAPATGDKRHLAGK